MPAITPQVRATIGGGQHEPILPRASIKAATGMNLPTLKESKQSEEALGQLDTKEETIKPAVTLDPQTSTLARNQQKLQAEIRALREKEAAFEKQKAEYVPKAEFKAKLQQNAAEALSELGTTYDELTSALLSQKNTDDPVRKLEVKIEQLEKSQEDNVNKQFDATLKQYRAEADSLIAADPKTYHFISKGMKSEKWNGECPVTTHILEEWKHNPDNVLTVEKAAKEIESFLRLEAKAEADALRELEALEKPAEETAPVAKKTLPPPPRATTRTLTEQVTSTPTRTQNMFQHMSMKERIAEAARRAQK